MHSTPCHSRTSPGPHLVAAHEFHFLREVALVLVLMLGSMFYVVRMTMLRTVPSISARVRAWFSVFCVRLVLASRKFKLLDHSRRFVSVM
jgi:hypothetical protein